MRVFFTFGVGAGFFEILFFRAVSSASCWPARPLSTPVTPPAVQHLGTPVRSGCIRLPGHAHRQTDTRTHALTNTHTHTHTPPLSIGFRQAPLPGFLPVFSCSTLALLGGSPPRSLFQEAFPDFPCTVNLPPNRFLSLVCLDPSFFPSPALPRAGWGHCLNGGSAYEAGVSKRKEQLGWEVLKLKP